MQLLISTDGRVRCLYDETLELRRLGPLKIQRASHVEPNEAGQWYDDLSPVDGPRLGPFETRSEALEAERHWLQQHRL